MNDSNVGRAAARADLCRLLAACYYQPGPEFIEEDVFGSMQAAAAQLDDEMTTPAKALAQGFGAQSHEALLVDYTRLFLNPTGPLAAPYESFWLGEKDPSRLQEVTQAVIAIYGEGGFEISEDFRDLPDHIAAELEYLYTLIFNEARADASNDAAGKIKASELRQRFVAAHLGPAVTEILARMKLSAGDVDRFICHPGGTKVIAALERALSLDQGTLDHEREVIADYGNMSAPTVLFVLERAMARGLPARSLLTALGPGFTASCVALRHAA